MANNVPFDNINDTDCDDEGSEAVQMPSRYRPSHSSGIYGSFIYITGDEDRKEAWIDQEDEKLTVMDQIEVQLQSIKKGVQQSRDDVYRLAKQNYRERGSPVMIDVKDTLTNIKENSANYKNVALPLTLAMDKDFSTWNEESFKQSFSNRFNIPIECIEIISVHAGSTIVDLKLNTHSNGAKLLLPIECIAENISNVNAKKALVEFGIFAMEFGEPTAGFSCLKQRVIMNPRWNREYGAGYTNWEGPLNDGKPRGGEPYYCPSGWKRFAVQFSENAYDFKNVYDTWPIAYHGTKFNVHMMITLSGLKAFGGAHGTAVYVSPSIKYVSHPRYCAPYKMDLSKASQAQWAAEHMNEFKKYDGKWIQCAYACRVKPDAYHKKRETMGLGTTGTFDGINKSEIEWIVPGNHGEIIGSDKILIYGFMIKASSTKPQGYDI